MSSSTPPPALPPRRRHSDLGSNDLDVAPVGRQRDRMVAGLLGILVGFTGAHHYYLGSHLSGLAVLLMSCCGVGLIVALVEGVMLLVMSDEEFDSKYNRRPPDAMEFVFQERL